MTKPTVLIDESTRDRFFDEHGDEDERNERDELTQYPIDGNENYLPVEEHAEAAQEMRRGF